MRRAAGLALAAALRQAAPRVAPAAERTAAPLLAAAAAPARQFTAVAAWRRAATPLTPPAVAPLLLPARGGVWSALAPRCRATTPAAAPTRAFATAPPAPAPPPGGASPLRRLAAAQGEAASRVRDARAAVGSAVAGLPAALPAVRASASARAEAWWAAHSRKFFAGVGLAAAVVIWRAMFSVAASFIDLSETVAEAGFFALALSMVAATGTAIAWRRRLNPEAVHRLAMRQLRASPTVLGVLGAPLVASDTRAFVLSGGGVKLKDWRPTLRSRRCHLLFPLSGAAARGIVSAEAKKQNGRYVFKLLAVDVPAARGGESRIYLAGDDEAYNKGHILSELRDPLIATLAQAPTHEAEDERDAQEPLPLPVSGAATEARTVLTVPEGAQQAPAPGVTAASPVAADDDLYAWDHFKAWLERKRERQAAEKVAAAALAAHQRKQAGDAAK